MPRNQQPLSVAFGETVQMNDGAFAVIKWSVTEGAVEVFRGNTENDYDSGVMYTAGTGERDVEASAIAHGAGPNLYMIGRMHPVSKVVVDHA
ncbi:hypothetical protein [uncultured Tateyamaria sp.]|uniref:hypothetical protein n=1 Tax=Tateyamaria sp. 1078 TaxID=3417464 RepID=UPI0026048986|nr:hypothetical protein [uncultured Tateyamaria sp.]